MSTTRDPLVFSVRLGGPREIYETLKLCIDFHFLIPSLGFVLAAGIYLSSRPVYT